MNRIKVYRLINFLVCICFLTVCFSGCASLRKKFTRKKKDKTSEQAFMPVLDPVDYPPLSQSFVEKYKYHYSLWKVWHRDLIQNIENNESDKNQKYLIGEIIAQLEEMKKIVVGSRKSVLDQYIQQWHDILSAYDRPLAMRSVNSLKKKVETLGKKTRDECKPELMEEFLIRP